MSEPRTAPDTARSAVDAPAAGENVSEHLRARAAEAPERSAVETWRGERISFGELEARVDALAHGLLEAGLRAGDRACLFVPPSPELIALTHAMFRAGVVPVLIDPGMGRKSLLSCVERVAPRALIGVARAHLARRLFPSAFRSVAIAIAVGPRYALGGVPLARLERAGAARGTFPIVPATPGSEAALLFTSGSTGPPKGVVYTHANFCAQLRQLASLYALRAGEVDVACFPLFALFDNALGMTSVFPDLDPSRPGRCRPERVFDAIERSGATFTFGSPAIWRRVLAWGRRENKRFSRLERLTIAGAPVPPSLIAGLREMLPEGGDVHTPYGATEALPVSSIAGRELAGELRARIEGGEGTCVGHPVPWIDVALIRITDEPLDAFSDALRVAPGEPGEVCVRGAVATPAYLFDEPATRLAKIPDGPDRDGYWHRMGDVGVLDDDGRLWLHGRKSHRIETSTGILMPVPVENTFLTIEGVRHAALVGVGPRGSERPLLVIEAEDGADRSALEKRVRERRDALGSPFEEIRFHPSFPVDVRHNAKIRREDLKRWAEAER